MITVTQSAARKVRSLLEKEGKHAFRISLLPGGCSGFTYDFALEEKEAEGDVAVESNGLTVLLDQQSARFMEGATLDYIQTLQQSGFKVDNPNFTHACGCGKSVG